MPVRVCPTWAVPVTVGRAVLRGTLGAAAAGEVGADCPVVGFGAGGVVELESEAAGAGDGGVGGGEDLCPAAGAGGFAVEAEACAGEFEGELVADGDVGAVDRGDRCPAAVAGAADDVEGVGAGCVAEPGAFVEDGLAAAAVLDPSLDVDLAAFGRERCDGEGADRVGEVVGRPVLVAAAALAGRVGGLVGADREQAARAADPGRCRPARAEGERVGPRERVRHPVPPPPAATTAAVWAELAGRLGPAVFVAVTWSRSVKPTSAATGT